MSSDAANGGPTDHVDGAHWPPAPLAEAQHAMDELCDRLIRFGLEYSSWRPGGTIHHDERLRRRVFRGRDDIIYRAKSVLWHATELNRSRRQVREAFRDKATSLQAHQAFPEGFQYYLTVHHHLFDDVVFNVQSIFDYLAALISDLRLPKRRLWGKLIADCSKNNSAVEPALSDALLVAHRAWVGKLGTYRGDLIHREAQSGTGQSTLDSDTLTMTRTVRTPPRFAARLATILGPDPTKLEVADAAALIAQQAFASTGHIIDTVDTKRGARPRHSAPG